jgi:hypothetical protein
VAALGRATGLTQLALVYCKRGDAIEPEEVGRALSRMSQLRELCLKADEVGEEGGLALSRMSQLRALSLTTYKVLPPSCVRSIGLLTQLTQLEMQGKYVTNPDLQVWLGLRKLRVMSILPIYPAPFDRITRETFFALAKLSELSKLTVWEKFGDFPSDLTDEIRTGLNAERHSKGWPSLDLTLQDLRVRDLGSGCMPTVTTVVRWEVGIDCAWL